MQDAKDKTDKSQSDKFKEAARELGCDDDEQAFDDKLRRVAKRKMSSKPENGNAAD